MNNPELEFIHLKRLNEQHLIDSLESEDDKLSTEELVELFDVEYGTDYDLYNIAEFVYDKFDKITGLPLESRNEEMQWPEEIFDFCNELTGDDNWFDANFEEFEESYGRIAELHSDSGTPNYESDFENDFSFD
jgi:hypothetical protein